MQQPRFQVEIPATDEPSGKTSGFSFSNWLIDSHNLRIYTAHGHSSLEISLSKISKHNQVREW